MIDLDGVFSSLVYLIYSSYGQLAGFYFISVGCYCYVVFGSFTSIGYCSVVVVSCF